MKRQYLILIHLLFWSLLLLSDAMQHYEYSHYQPTIARTLLITSTYMLINVTAFYGGYALIYRFLIRPWPWPGWLAIINIPTTLFLIVIMRYVVEFGILKPMFQYDNYSVNPNFTWAWFVKNAVLFYWNWALYGVLYGFAENYVQQQQRAREQMKAEVSLLRAQVNPHFLFNVLNDFYALSLTQPGRMPDALLKLADLLRYMLYSSQSVAVPLTEEVAYVKSYIDLEQLGQSVRDNVQTSFTGAFDNRQIAPMLLIPFVENAFKHGALHQNQAITIDLTADDRQLIFRCCNAKQAGQKDKTGGIGLANIRRRLALEYPDRHSLRINDTDTLFDIDLHITF
jgi:hypothetical protein